MTGDESHDEVLEWLGDGLSPSPPAYLRLLGPGGDERGDRVLANLGAVAARLRDRPECWGSLIRARNWRPTLVGCSAVLLARDARFLDDLLYRFHQGSWVVPQLAVALGLSTRTGLFCTFDLQPTAAGKGETRIGKLKRTRSTCLVHRAEAVPEFEDAIRQPGTSADFKRVFSAYAVLKLLGLEAAQEFEASDLFRRSQAESVGTSSSPAYASLVAVSAVRGQWNFWLDRGPH
jgi:hypothetical protein